MRTFSIDSENNITVIASAQQAQAGESFGSEQEWHRLTADWPTSRLLDTWNSIPGFTPVNRFKDRKTATARIWKAIQSLGGGVGAPAATVAPGKASARKKTRRAQKSAHADTRVTRAKEPRRAHKPTPKKPKAEARRPGTKTAQVLGMLQRPNGATLKELIRITGWQAHSVRGFLSGQVGKKMNLSVRSFQRDGERVYSLKA
jgi:hypothetical protein